MARMKNSRFAHHYVPPAVFPSILLFVLNFVPSYAVGATDEQHPGQGNRDRKSQSDLRIMNRAAGSNPRCPFLRSN